MSIKDFHNRPCETCNADTLHLAGKCQDCGTVSAYSNFVMFQRRRRSALVARGFNHAVSAAIINSHGKVHAAARREYFNSVPKRKGE